MNKIIDAFLLRLYLADINLKLNPICLYCSLSFSN